MIQQHIHHNHPVTPRHSHGRWFLSGISTDTMFIFVHSTRMAQVMKTAVDGWTLADAHSFATMLNRR